MQTDIVTSSAHFIDLFQYDAWANQKVIEALGAAIPAPGEEPGRETPPEVERAVGLLSHLLRSQTVWLGRLTRTPEQMDLPIWENDPLDACAARREENTRAWLQFLRNCTTEDFHRRVDYTNTKGQAFASTVREIATHVVNHGSYHRAQVALLLRAAAAEPPVTDYIAYARSR